MPVKKTQTKAFANLVTSVLLIAFEIWAWTLTNSIKTVKHASVQPCVFPRIMIIGMAVFTVVLLIQSLIKLGEMNLGKIKPDDHLAARAESVNPFKDRGVLAAVFVMVLCVLYVLLFKTLGYVVDSFLICAIIMWLISVRKPAPLLLISFLVPLGMWLLFYKLLTVNIPMGILQFLRDLVDKI